MRFSWTKSKIVACAFFCVGGLLLICGPLFGINFINNSMRDSGRGISPASFYAAQFRNLSGAAVSLGQWQGKVLVINFWASWCIPCRDEIPLLIDTQRQFTPYGVQVIGLAVDAPQNINPLFREAKINYPVLIAEDNGIELAKRLGNRASVLPFTALIDRYGRVMFTTVGVLERQQLDADLRKLI